MKTFKRVSYDDTALSSDRPRLDSQIKSNWLNALRSGLYKQSTGKLEREDNSCCCLGVLCNVQQIPKTFISAPYGNGYYKFSFERSNSVSYLPSYIPNISDVLDVDGKLPVAIEFLKFDGVYHQWRTLAELNDQGATFEEIAWIIEEVY